MNVQSLHHDLNKELDSAWSEFMGDNPMIKLIKSGSYDLSLYGIYLIETYHYTRHNTRNQALVAVRSDHTVPTRYVKFCLNHALEETGHEYMALHDLKSIGFDIEEANLPQPLSATQALIGYLYWISATGNPLARLGYSFWAENVYRYIQEPLGLLAKKFELKPTQMTFFTNHSDIDAKHAEEIVGAMNDFAKTEKDRTDLLNVMRTSLRLTSLMLEDVTTAYNILQSGKPSPYSFLKKS